MIGLKSLFIITAIVCTYVLTPGANGKRPSKIVGGHIADDNDAKPIAAVENGWTHQTCSGTIIGNSWIITAASCLVIGRAKKDPKMYPMHYINVKTGSKNRKDINKVLLSSVCNVNIHNKFLQYPPTASGDIAILTLCEPLPLGVTRQPALLPNRQYRPGNKGVVFGWGWTEPENSMSIDVLKKAQMTITLVDDDQLIAIGKSGDAFCNGDNGGPLLINNTLIGIVSNSPDCTGNTHGSYTNVHAFSAFINDVIKYGSQSVFSGYVKTIDMKHF